MPLPNPITALPCATSLRTAAIGMATALMAGVLGMAGALAEGRLVTDDAGREVNLPEKTDRIVVLHEPLVGVPIADLGREILGSYGRDDAGKMLTRIDFLETVLGPRAQEPRPTGIGPIGNIDLEKVRALDPDLIIGTEFDVKNAERLAAVAPVYLQAVSAGRIYGFGVEEDLAALLGEETRFEARKAQFLGKLAETREATGDAGAGKTYLAVIIHDKINLVGQMSGMIEAVEGLGYTRADVGETGVARGFGSTFGVPLSPEVFVRLDPDLMIVLGSYVTGQLDPSEIEARLDRIAPGWQRFLKPAREGRLIYVDATEVTMPTIASAEHMLDALAEWAGR